MATNTRPELTREEFIKLSKEEANMTIEPNGKTSLICPVCKRSLYYFENDSSYSICCEDDNCIKLDYRGI